MSNPNSPYGSAGEPQGNPQYPNYPGYEDTRSTEQGATQAYGNPDYSAYDETQAYPGTPQPMNETQPMPTHGDAYNAQPMQPSQPMPPTNATQPMPPYGEPYGGAPQYNAQPRTTEYDGAAQAQPTQAFDYGQMQGAAYGSATPQGSGAPQASYGNAAPQGNGGGYGYEQDSYNANGYDPNAANGNGYAPANTYGGNGQMPPQIPPDGNAPFNGQQPPKNNKTPIIIVSVVAALLLIACIVFAVIALNKNDDNKGGNESPSATHSQTSSPKSTDDPTDDPFGDLDDPDDDPTDDPSDDPFGTGGGLDNADIDQALRDGKTLEQAFSNPEVKKAIEQAIEGSSGDTEGMTMDVSAKGNTLIYKVRFTDSEYDAYESLYSSMMDGILCSPMSEFVKQLEDEYSLKDAKVEFILETSKGKTIMDKTYDSQSQCDVSMDDYDSLLND